MTYVYAGAADWGGKDPAKCNRGLYRLATDTGTWTTLDRGLPDEVEVRSRVVQVPVSVARRYSPRFHFAGSLPPQSAAPA